jgi:glycosyltransferase involved in cell wall biosynthesis
MSALLAGSMRSTSEISERERPLVSIVTPSLNMAPYIGEAIESVLAQDYPRIEYIVVDGGSSDGTADVLRRFQTRVRVISGPDRGAADAVNRGFAASSGSIFAFLSADDVYTPGAVSRAVEAFSECDCAVVYGDGVWIDARGAEIGAYPTRDFDRNSLEFECYICQPASFIRREAFESVGGLDPELHFTYDYDLWLRIARTWDLRRIPGVLAKSRMHPVNKTLGSRRAVLRENVMMLRRTAGYAPFPAVYAYCCHLVDGRDQFFEPLRPSIPKYVLALLMGVFVNRERAPRYVAEWARVMLPARSATPAPRVHGASR